jgi:hypothetical protein
VHGAAVGEVAAWPLVGHAGQRLEADDVVGAQRGGLGAAEPQHQLAVVGDLVGVGHAGLQRQLLGDAWGAKAAAQEADPLAGQVEQVADEGAIALVGQQRA